MRSNTNNGIRGKTSFVLIGCERSGQYMAKKKDLVRTCTGNRKCGCPFKLCVKLVVCWRRMMDGEFNLWESQS